jgi:hypothetical protein
MMLGSVEIVVLVFCVAAVLATPVWVVARFVVPPRRVH